MDVTTRIWLDENPSNDDKDSKDERDPFVRDADIVLYSSAFRRLKGVTQVLPVVSGMPRVHDRMIHSLKVAQVGRSIAERLLCKYEDYEGTLLPNAVYVAGLAHDLGHPPFGHIAEKELQRILKRSSTDGCDRENEYTLEDSFEGNAQTFRILVRLSQKSGNPDLTEGPRRGMGLTAGSLISVLKYPWPKGESRDQLESFGRRWEDGKRNYYEQKWGVYSDDLDPFLTIGEALLKDRPGLIMNSQIMDLADDITYAVHDVQDHYRSGQIPLELLALGNDDQFRVYATSVVRSKMEFDRDGKIAEEAWKWINELEIPGERYVDSRQARASLHLFGSEAVRRIIDSVDIDRDELNVCVPPHIRIAVEMLKQLTWYYVIDNPALSASQLGQTKMIHDLHTWLCEWLSVCIEDSEVGSSDQKQHPMRKLPQRLRDYYDDTENSRVSRKLLPAEKIGKEGALGAKANDDEMGDGRKRYDCGHPMSRDERISRAVVDYIASLTDDEAITLHHNLGAYGSVVPVSWL